YTNPMPDIAEVNESVSIDLEIIPDLVRPIRIGYYGMGPALNFSVGGSGTLTAVPTVSEYDANRQSEFFLISEKKAQLQDGREEARARDNAVADIARIARRTRGGAAGRQTGLSMAKLAFERPVLTVRKIGRVRPTNLCREFRTPPLWGVASTAPYMHDGRCDTLMDAILMHEGEAEASQRSFTGMPRADQEAIIAFLNTFEIQDPQQ
ncbi:MAG: di-heme oxidoredictase family protein, partial [Planctomycetota bacterium]